MFDEARPVPARQVWSVGALVLAVGDALAVRFGACTVRGELSGFSRAGSGHCYFNLKDADGGVALIRCALFRRAASLLDFAPADGQQVELRGRLTVYEARGELQMVVESMQRAGAGSLYEQFLLLKAKLERLGCFDPARKRPLPAYPRRIGVVTSLGGAALHDVASALARRAPHVRLIVYPSLVQGAAAPQALSDAIATAGRRAEVDTLIVCRGGGSLEDLWAFNDERVVQAIVASKIPVVCGVGHETDVSLADFAADLRAPTPTAAAELAAPSTQACLDVLAACAVLLRRRVGDALDGQAQRLDRLSLRLARPGETVRRRAQQLELLAHRLEAARRVSLERRHAALLQAAARLQRGAAVVQATHGQRLASLASRLQTLDPKHVLSRGYAWLSDRDGRPVSSVRGLAVGSALRTVLVDGSADVSVTAVTPARP